MRFRAGSALLAGLTAVAVVAAVAQQPARQQAAGGVMTVYMTPTCGCCKLWTDHMKAAGFQVRVVDMEDLT